MLQNCVISCFCHIQPGQGKTELCSYWSGLKERSVHIGYGVKEAVFQLVQNFVISCFCHIQPGRPQIPSSGKSQFCFNWSMVKKPVLQLARGLRERCSYCSRLCDFLFFIISILGGGKTEMCSYWSSVKKPVFQLASGLRKQCSYWSLILLFLVFVKSNQGVFRYV